MKGFDMVRAKFKVVTVEAYEGDEGAGRVLLEPVYDEDPHSENGQFYKYTPAGRIELSTINPFVLENFEVDKEYYVDFSPAE